MKTRSKKFREAKAEVSGMVNNFTSALTVWGWLRKYGADTREFSAWNYDSGICYHTPTQRAVHQSWTEQEVKDFCSEIVKIPTVV